MKNIFLSFSMTDENLVDLFRGQAKNDSLPLEFYDYSIQEPFDSKWKTECEEKIKNHTSITICLIGQDTYTREAVIWELTKSYELGKGVFGVIIDKKASYYPQVMADNGAVILNRNHRDIMNEINRLSS